MFKKIVTSKLTSNENVTVIEKCIYFPNCFYKSKWNFFIHRSVKTEHTFNVITKSPKHDIEMWIPLYYRLDSSKVYEISFSYLYVHVSTKCDPTNQTITPDFKYM